MEFCHSSFSQPHPTFVHFLFPPGAGGAFPFFLFPTSTTGNASASPRIRSKRRRRHTIGAAAANNVNVVWDSGFVCAGCWVASVPLPPPPPPPGKPIRF